MSTTTAVKTPGTLDVAARRRLATAALQHPLDPAAHQLLEALTARTDSEHGPMEFYANGQPDRRWVYFPALRAATALDAAAFDTALRRLIEAHRAEIRVCGASTAEEDAASFRHLGTDYHKVTVDRWNARPPAGADADGE